MTTKVLAMLAYIQMETERLAWKEQTLKLYGKLDWRDEREDCERKAQAAGALAEALSP